MNGRTIIIVSTGGLLLILVAVGIALLSGRKLTLSLPVARHGVAAGAASGMPRQDAAAAASSDKPSAIAGLWVRPPAKLTARHS